MLITILNVPLLNKDDLIVYLLCKHGSFLLQEATFVMTTQLLFKLKSLRYFFMCKCLDLDLDLLWTVC